MKKHLALIVTALTISSFLASSQTNNCLPKPILGISRQGTTALQLDLTGEPGINYAIEQSDDFGQCTRVATNRSSSGLLSFTYPLSDGMPQQFFRALSVNSTDGFGGAFIFDGQTFSGWEGDTTNVFRIVDCAIVGGSLSNALAQNMYLCTSNRYTNFILRLEFKVVGTNVNSGVQFRSERAPSSTEVSGYQADMVDGFWGSLYDQSRRNSVLAAANQTAVAAVLRTNDWNAYMIQGDGARIQFWINDLQTIGYTETNGTIPRYGIIGFQIHSGGRFEASFRRITLEVLP